MAATMIPDEELLRTAETITVWVASPNAPTDIWSLSQAIAWVMQANPTQRLSLFRPPGEGQSAAWVEATQIERLAQALGIEPHADAA